MLMFLLLSIYVKAFWMRYENVLLLLLLLSSSLLSITNQLKQVELRITNQFKSMKFGKMLLFDDLFV